MTLALLLCMSSALANGAGSSSDPLLTQSYIDEFVLSREMEANTAIQGSLDSVRASLSSALEALDDIDTSDYGLGEYQTTDGYKHMASSAGGTVTILNGSSIIVTGGTVQLNVLRGTVVNISTAEEISVGAVLTAGQRYFCCEETEAEFMALTDADLMVDGCYTLKNTEIVYAEYLDITSDKWYYDGVVFACKNKLFFDLAGANFRPEDKADRATLVYSLWRLAGSPAPDAETVFLDVSADHPCYEACAWAYEAGIVQGYGDGYYGPDDLTNRQQLAVIMFRYAQYLGESTSRKAALSLYKDSNQIASWARDAMAWTNAAKLITGISEDELAPLSQVRRNELATLLMRYYNFIMN